MDPQEGNGQERRHSKDLSGQSIVKNGSRDKQERGSHDNQQQSSDNNRDREKSFDSPGSQSFHDVSKIQASQERKSKQEDSQGSSPEAQIKFYSQFAEKAVANLKDVTDKVLAARWILFLERQPVSVVRAEYFKQLLFVCLHGRLAGVFAKPPAETIEHLPQHHTMEWLSGQISLLRCKDQIPIQQEMSESRTEYLAVQNIPYFGTHVYFAVSNDPIDKWESAARESEYTKI